MMTAAQATWGIAALATAGVIVRPWRLPEAIWAVLGAAALVVFGLLSWSDALVGVLKGTDVYLFLTGMMLLAELARLAASPVHAGLCGRHGGDGAALQRRDRGRAHARRLCGNARGRRCAAALSLRLCVHRQCGELRATDLQSGQPGDLRQPHAAPRRMACTVRAADDRRRGRDIPDAAPDPARRAAPPADRPRG